MIAKKIIRGKKWIMVNESLPKMKQKTCALICSHLYIFIYIFGAKIKAGTHYQAIDSLLICVCFYLKSQYVSLVCSICMYDM